jgi:hypothetical protein
MANEDVQQPSDLIKRLSQALEQISRGDPVVALRNELDARFGAVQNEIDTRFVSVDTRFEGIDKATVLQHDDMVRVPTLLQTAMEGQRTLTDEKLGKWSADLRGELIRLLADLRGEVAAYVAETREKFVGVTSQFNQNDKALTAALQAQEKQAIATTDNTKEALKEMKEGFTKLLDALVLTMNTKTGNLENSINEIKGMIISLQSRGGATTENRRDSREDQRNSLSMISVVISIAALAAIIIIELVKR